MFRLGTLLFIPGYISVTLYRLLANPESGGSLIVMIRKCLAVSFAEWLLFCSRGTPSLSFTSLDDQHVSVTRFFSRIMISDPTSRFAGLCDIAARHSRSPRCRSFSTTVRDSEHVVVVLVTRINLYFSVSSANSRLCEWRSAEHSIPCARFRAPSRRLCTWLPLSMYLPNELSDDACQVWSATVQGDPSGYYFGFVMVGAACGLAVIHSFFIR